MPDLNQLISRMRKRCDSAGAKTLFDRLIQMKPVQQLVQDHGDAADLPFAMRQLEYIFTQLVEAEYPNLAFADTSDPVVPWNTEVPAGSRTFTYYLMDHEADAVFVGALGDGELPQPSLIGGQVDGRVENFANEVAVSFRELRSAAVARQPLDAMLGQAARMGHSKRLHQTAAWGREDLGIPGFLNHPNIPVVEAANKAGGTPAQPTQWELATPTELIADVVGLVLGIKQDSFGIYVADTVAMGSPKMDILRTRQLSVGQDGILTTVMEFIQKVLPGVRFRELEDLRAENSLGNLDDDAMLAYVNRADRVELVVPGGFFFFAQPQYQKGLKIMTPYESEIGGIKLPHPLSAAIMHGI